MPVTENLIKPGLYERGIGRTGLDPSGRGLKKIVKEHSSIEVTWGKVEFKPGGGGGGVLGK